MSEDATPLDLSDRISEAYYGLIPGFSEEFFERTRRRVHWICAQTKGDTILDIGCSQGMIPILLAREGKKCLGLDVNAKSIEQAQSYLQQELSHTQSNVTFVHADATLYDYAGQKFDTILLAEVLEHLLHPARLVDLAACLLNPNGRLVITLPFGVNAYLDHKATYYGHRAYELLTRHFSIVDIVLLEGWIGFVATNDPASCHIPPLTAWESTEDAFLAMEQSLRNDLSKTRSQFKAMKAQQASREAEFSHKLKEAEAKAKEARADFEKKLSSAAAKENEYARQLKETEAKAKEARADFDKQSVAAAAREMALTHKLEEAESQAYKARDDFDKQLAIAAEREADLARSLEEAATMRQEADVRVNELEKQRAIDACKLKEVEAKATQGADHARALRDMLIAAIAEKDRLAAVNQAQLRFLQREAHNTWDSRAAAILRTVDSPSSLALLPVNLHRLQREAKGRVPKSLGGDSFSELITAYANGGFDQVDALLAQTSASSIVKANGYTVLARHLKNLDAKQACEAARRAYEEDPQSYRRKWLAFQLYAAGNAHGADILLSTLPEDLALSLSESRQLEKIKASAGRERISLVKAEMKQYDKQNGDKAVKGNAARQNSIYSSDDSLIFTARQTGQFPLCAHREPKKSPPLLAATGDRKLRIAAIMDTFTYHSYAPEADILQLHPEQWERQFEDFKPDILFIESAWEGMDNLWNQKISAVSPELKSIIEAASIAGIPSLFWNKEDPVHFASFLALAKIVDYVFTTDSDCIPRYKAALGKENIFFLPFAAQPAIHNPIEKFERKNAVNFAGSYYSRYPDRQRDFSMIVDVAGQYLPVEIYDRNYGKDMPNHVFPEKYTDMIIGHLPLNEIDRAYKGYQFGININTVKQSQTMFARRVYELLASNTLVLSNFSRGMRLIFGDLVLSSESGKELLARLGHCLDDDLYARKLRLLGLRKVMAEHTYEHRLDFIRAKLGAPVLRWKAPVCLLATVHSSDEKATALANFDRQAYPEKNLLLLVNTKEIAEASSARPDITYCSTAAEIQNALRERTPQTLVGVLSTADYYGLHYLTDLAQAFTWSHADACGKIACYAIDIEHASVADSTPILNNDGSQYRPAAAIPARSGLIRLEALTEAALDDCLVRPETAAFISKSGFATDEFHYIRQGAGTEATAFVEDLPLPNQGVSLETLNRVVNLLSLPTASGKENSDLPHLSSTALYTLFGNTLNKGKVRGELTENGLQFRSSLEKDQHSYMYIDKIFSREELNMRDNCSFLLQKTGELTIHTVFVFLDNKENKLSHQMSLAGENYTLSIPPACESVRFGLRFLGSGKASVKKLLLSAPPVPTSAIICRSPYLVLTKQYPAYDDLYKYGFLHTRVRAYQEHGLSVDIFRVRSPQSTGYAREFDGIDVNTGTLEQLDATLRLGTTHYVLAHLMDPTTWWTLRPHRENLKIFIWVHGADIHMWQRRLFNFEHMGEGEIERQKKMSDERMDMWRDIMEHPHPNTHLVFVSRSLLDEALSDLQLPEPPKETISIIHNFIDGNLFAYTPKTSQQRLKILTLRPFSSRKYANDLTAATIIELSKRHFFSELEFCIIGDGPLFEEVTDPLRVFPNVSLQNRFLPQDEMLAMYNDYGIFLIPTRHDAQGVTRDEALASGLVPITNKVAAIPEFVDENSGFVVPPEDYVAMADAIEKLYHNPELFLKLSRSAAERVRSQSNFDATIGQEMRLIGHD